VRLTTAVAGIIRDIIAGALAQKRYVPQSDWERAATGAARPIDLGISGEGEIAKALGIGRASVYRVLEAISSSA
jgi:hypothetical protein